MSERQRELIHDLRIELEETKAKLASAEKRASKAVERIATAAATEAIAQQTSVLKAQLAASQGREAAMRAALSRLVKVYDVRETQTDGIIGMDWDSSPDANAAGEAWADAKFRALATDGSGWVSPETVSGLVEALEVLFEIVADDDPDWFRSELKRARAALAAFEKRGGK